MRAVRAGDGEGQGLGFQDASGLSKQVDSREKVVAGKETVIGRTASPVKQTSRSDWVWGIAAILGRRPGKSNRVH